MKHSPPSKIVTRPDEGMLLLVLVCFFFSGLTGLIYEVLWTRMVVKIIGGAPFAVSIILTVFMGGLGLGSYLAGRTVDNVREPKKLVRIYGILELVIGAYGLVLPVLLLLFRPLYAVIYNQLFDHFILYNLLTFIGCILLFCIPVVCMGATLPILCRFYVTELTHLGTNAGRLYGLNTIGAALGALLCGFWLISFLGTNGTLILAVGINTAIGFSCLAAGSKSRRQKRSKKQKVEDSKQYRKKETDDRKPVKENPAVAKGALVIFAVSGFCAMAYEVIWTKLLGLVVGPTTYSFTIILVTFILGLAIGSIVFGRFADKTRKVIWLLIYSQVAAALFVLGISQLLGNSQLFFAKLIFQFQERFAVLSLLKTVILFAFMILPTICLGATFPLVNKIYTQSVSKVGKSIGFAYAVNTIGAVLGSFCAGFVLIPLLGKENSLSFVVGLQLLTAFVIASIVLFKNKEKMLRLVPAALLTLLGLSLCFHFPAWDRHLLSLGKYHRFEEVNTDVQSYGWFNSLLDGPEILSRTKQGELVYYGDGIGGFTTVIKYVYPLGKIKYVMANSGKPDASSVGDMKIQTLLAHFPMIFHEDPKTVMVLGLASGVTAGEVLYYPIEKLDVIDISREVVKGSSFFVPWNNDVLSNPKTNMIVQDARAHLQLTRQMYDVIISEPSNPWMAGLATLFTRDFFVLAKNKLNQNGIFVQWIHSYQMDWTTFALIGRTFAQVFPNSMLVRAELSDECSDYLLVGFKTKESPAIKDPKQKLSCVRRSNNVTLLDPELMYVLIASEDLQELFGRGPIDTDSRPRVEFTAPKLMHYSTPDIISSNIKAKKRHSPAIKEKIQKLGTNVDAQVDFAAYALSVFAPFENMVNLSRCTSSQGERFFKLMDDYCAGNAIDYSILKNDQLKQRCRRIQIETLEEKIQDMPDRAISYSYLGELYYQENRLDDAIGSYVQSLELEPNSAVTRSNLGVALAGKGMIKEAIFQFEEALKINPGLTSVKANLERARDILKNPGRQQ